MSDVKILPAFGIGEYRVELDGQQIGRVRKRHESYHGIRGSGGRRLGTYTYWDAYELDRDDHLGIRVPGACIARGERTRRDAVAALVARSQA